MRRILIIEPYRLLQHGFAAALFAEYQLAIVATVPESPGDAELAIVDAAALRERGLLRPAELEILQGWQVPVVWLDADDRAKAPKLAKMTRATWPLDKGALNRALLAGRPPPGAPNPTPSAAAHRAEKASRNRARAKQSQDSGATGNLKENIIELVDVVEVVGGDGGQMDSAKKE